MSEEEPLDANTAQPFTEFDTAWDDLRAISAARSIVDQKSLPEFELPSSLLPADSTSAGFHIEQYEHTEPILFSEIALTKPEAWALIRKLYEQGRLKVQVDQSVQQSDAEYIDTDISIYFDSLALNDTQRESLGIGPPVEGPLEPINIDLDQLPDSQKRAILEHFAKDLDWSIQSLISEPPFSHMGSEQQKVLDILDTEYLAVPELSEYSASINELFKINDGAEQVMLYNLCGSDIPERALNEFLNAIRETSDETGGTITEKLNNIVVLPEGHERFSVKDWPDDKVALGVANKETGTIYLNSRIFRLEGTDRPLTIDGGVSVAESVMRHELGHFEHFEAIRKDGADTVGPTLGWEQALDSKEMVKSDDYVAFPKSYGNTSPMEDVAESLTAIHHGGDKASSLDPGRVRAMQSLTKKINSGIEGPRYLRVVKIDPHNLSAKLGETPKYDKTVLRLHIKAEGDYFI